MLAQKERNRNYFITYYHNWYSYVKPEGDGLMLGLFEWTGTSCNDKEIQNKFPPREISPDNKDVTGMSIGQFFKNQSNQIVFVNIVP